MRSTSSCSHSMGDTLTNGDIFYKGDLLIGFQSFFPVAVSQINQPKIILMPNRHILG